MTTVNPKIVRCSEEEKASFFKTLCLHMSLNIDMNKIQLNYVQRFKNCDRNGNSKYNYSFYGMDRVSGRIYDMTWQVSNILALKYDYNRMFIIADDMLPTYVEKELNKYNTDNNMDFMDIKLIEVV